jgi:hypothetical protein
MADPGRTGVRGRNGQDLRLDGGESGAEQFDRRARPAQSRPLRLPLCLASAQQMRIRLLPQGFVSEVRNPMAVRRQPVYNAALRYRP